MFFGYSIDLKLLYPLRSMFFLFCCFFNFVFVSTFFEFRIILPRTVNVTIYKSYNAKKPCGGSPYEAEESLIAQINAQSQLAAKRCENKIK
jgi:hypothetical protein